MSKKTKEYRAQIAEQFIQLLQEKELDWKRDWQISGSNHPLNAKSGYYYHGINQINLVLIAIQRNYKDPRWATFKQIESQGWTLNNAKGQGVKVEYWYMWDPEEKKSISWTDYRKIEEKENRYELRSKYTTVFNADLIQGIPPLPEPEKRETQVDQLIERISRNMGVEILNDGGERAFYSITEDRIHLPDPQIFYSDYGYNSTALHELSHATGAPHRLNRNLGVGDRFGSEKYAYEELVAEINSCFISENLQIEQEQRHIDNHKAYVQSWIKAIREDPEILVKAVQEAEKAADYLEFKAELIEKKDYEKKANLSFEIKDDKGVEKIKDKGVLSVLAELQKTGSINEWNVNQIGLQYRLSYHGDEVLKGSEEEVLLAIERITYAQEKGTTFGEMLKKLREENDYSVEQLAQIVLVSEPELKLIEEGKIYPDTMTLQMIGNLCSVSLGDLDSGKIVPKRSREELQELLRELQQQINEIQNDTIFFQEFIKKYNIPIEQESKDYYVIDDLKTGQTVQSLDHRELRIENQAAARHLANQLNQANELTEAVHIIEEYEKSIGRRESMIPFLEQNHYQDYSVACKRYLDFGRNVERTLSRELSQRESIKVCDTPQIFRDAGMRHYPMNITQKHLRDIMREEDFYKHFHGITLEQIKRLPEALESPALIAESFTQENAIIAILGYRENNGDPILVSIYPGGKAFYQMETINSNFITSVYGRKNVQDFVCRLIDAEKIIYIDQKKSKELALLPLQLRQDHLVPAFDCIIRQIGEKVNQNKEKIIKSSEEIKNSKLYI